MNRKYDTIGTGYNITRHADPYITARLLHHLQPTPDKLYLDIGCGTGNYTIALAEKGFRFVGVEPSEQMLTEGRARNDTIVWLQGTAEQIPAEDKVFRGGIGTLTIHHWTDLKKAFAEIDRVLSYNSKFVLFTSTPEQMKRYWLNHYFPKMLQSSIVQMPSLEDIQKAIEQSELVIKNTEKYFIKDDLQDRFLFVGKNNPALYFDETIRRGISSFSSLANIMEVEQGLSNLKSDLETGAFDKIKDRYENESGDYLFIIMEKKGRM